MCIQLLVRGEVHEGTQCLLYSSTTQRVVATRAGNERGREGNGRERLGKWRPKCGRPVALIRGAQ
jgi:hypothetical protein